MNNPYEGQLFEDWLKKNSTAQELTALEKDFKRMEIICTVKHAFYDCLKKAGNILPASRKANSRNKNALY